MIAKGYRQYKEQVLGIYNDFSNMCEGIGKLVDNSISSQAEKIKGEIFNLMILGEAKSGKSTFINAYLGEEIVPMDVRQCTSAIIKIHRGETCELVAKTAAGGRHVEKGIDSIQGFLTNHASISDKYRSIPVTTINNDLLIKYKGNSIPERVIRDFIEEAQKDNIYNIDPSEYKKIIRKYINDTRYDWGKIITEIDITYPLHQAMQGITIIDSPGVGAGGNVGIIAENYIKEANAIIFIKSMSGQALESSSFLNFLRNTCREKKKDSLFLVLTGKSNLQGSEVARLKEQAIDMYKSDIIEDKIIIVDSKVQLFLNRCLKLKTEERIDNYFEELDQSGNDFAPASKCWLKSKGNVAVFEEKMDELSNFSGVHNALERFARIAQYIQLFEFLENLEQEYKRYKANYSEALKISKDSIDDPVALEDRIELKKKELAEVFIKINERLGLIYQKYTDNINGEGIIMREADKKRKEYNEKIDHFRNLAEAEINSTTFSNMKKITMDAVDDAISFRDMMAKRIILDFNNELIHCTDDPSIISADTLKPNFTEADFYKINTNAKKNATESISVTEGHSFNKTTTTKSIYDSKKHVKIVANNICSRLEDDIIPAMIKNVMTYIGNCREIYAAKLKEHKTELESEYKKLLECKDSNEKRLKHLDELEKKLITINLGLDSVYRLKEELKTYVNQ